MIKKDLKPYMVDNLRQFLEKETLMIPGSDDELYMQLISYIVSRTTQHGRPVFEAGGSAADHAHDALILGLLAVSQNYGEFSKIKIATNIESVSNKFFMPEEQKITTNNEKGKTISRADKINVNNVKFGMRKKTPSKIKRNMF